MRLREKAHARENKRKDDDAGGIRFAEVAMEVEGYFEGGLALFALSLSLSLTQTLKEIDVHTYKKRP